MTLIHTTFQAKAKSILAFACIILCFHTLHSQTGNAAKTQPDDTLQYNRKLGEVTVRGVTWKKVEKIGHMSMSGVEINKRPTLFGEHDVIKALQSTSGVVSGTEGFAGLYVRGGETDQNLYLLDGLPLLNVYHFGGLFSTFNTNTVENVDFYKGTFPSLYGERASSIVDVATRKPDYNNTTGSLSVGLISGQAYFTTPLKKGRSAISVALRRTWFDAFSIPTIAILNATKKSDGKKTIYHYNFTDMQVKLSATDSHRNDLSLLLFYGKDNFKLGEEKFDPTDSKIVYQKDLNKLSWSNWGITASYRVGTPIGVLSIQPYVSKAFALDGQENMDDKGVSGNLTTTTEIRPSVLQVGMRENFKFNIISNLRGEAGLQQVWYNYKVGNQLIRYDGIEAMPNTSPYADSSKNGILSGFGELHWNVANTVRSSVGLRANRYLSNIAKHWNLEPRVSVAATLPHESSVSLGYSHVAQYTQQVSSNYMYLPSDAWLPTASIGKPLTCDIYSLGYARKIKQDFNVKAELWWKRMNNLAEYKPNTSVTTTTLPWYSKMTFGKGWAYGLDIEAEGRYKSINWNVAYTLMWNWRKFPKINSGKRYPAKFDNRHKLDVNIGWKINTRFELNGQWEYMTGNRTSLPLYNIATPDIAFPDAPFVNPIDPGGNREDGIDYLEGRNNVRIPAFHRLSLNLSMKGRINDRLTYQWDFGLYNAYCHMNAFSIVKDYVNSNWSNNGDYRRFKTLSLLPILPSVSYTLNF